MTSWIPPKYVLPPVVKFTGLPTDEQMQEFWNSIPINFNPFPGHWPTVSAYEGMMREEEAALDFYRKQNPGEENG